MKKKKPYQMTQQEAILEGTLSEFVAMLRSGRVIGLKGKITTQRKPQDFLCGSPFDEWLHAKISGRIEISWDDFKSEEKPKKKAKKQ